MYFINTPESKLRKLLSQSCQSTKWRWWTIICTVEYVVVHLKLFFKNKPGYTTPAIKLS